jgi:hypothetical protein
MVADNGSTLQASFINSVIPWENTVWHHVLMAGDMRTGLAIGFLDGRRMDSPSISWGGYFGPAFPDIWDNWTVGGRHSATNDGHIGELTAVYLNIEDRDYVTLLFDPAFRRKFRNPNGTAAEIGGSGFIDEDDLGPNIYCSGDTWAFGQGLPSSTEMFLVNGDTSTGIWTKQGAPTNGLSDPFSNNYIGS